MNGTVDVTEGLWLMAGNHIQPAGCKCHYYFKQLCTDIEQASTDYAFVTKEISPGRPLSQDLYPFFFCLSQTHSDNKGLSSKAVQ